MNPLEKRCVELSYKHRLSHVSSVLNTVNVLAKIYLDRKPDDPVVLGNSHAALALFVVLEVAGLCDAEQMVKDQGTHASRDMQRGIWVSGGSLGQAETIAVGMAMADRGRDVWLITSDGACAEGAVWEAFALASQLNLQNLKIHVIANGFSAYKEVDVARLTCRLSEFLYPVPFKIHRPVLEFSWIQGLPGHYVVLNEEQYKQMMQ